MYGKIERDNAPLTLRLIYMRGAEHPKTFGNAMFWNGGGRRLGTERFA